MAGAQNVSKDRGEIYVLLKHCVIISLVQIYQVVETIMVHLVLMICISNQASIGI